MKICMEKSNKRPMKNNRKQRKSYTKVNAIEWENLIRLSYHRIRLTISNFNGEVNITP